MWCGGLREKGCDVHSLKPLALQLARPLTAKPPPHLQLVGWSGMATGFAFLASYPRPVPLCRTGASQRADRTARRPTAVQRSQLVYYYCHPARVGAGQEAELGRLWRRPDGHRWCCAVSAKQSPSAAGQSSPYAHKTRHLSAAGVPRALTCWRVRHAIIIRLLGTQHCIEVIR